MVQLTSNEQPQLAELAKKLTISRTDKTTQVRFGAPTQTLFGFLKEQWEQQRQKQSQQQPATVPVGGTTLCELTSEELAWQAGRGCQASFAELVRRYAPRLQAFLRRRTRDRHEAEDLVQDTFLKAYRSLDRYDESWRFSTWLFTIASRTAVSHHRRKRPDVVQSEVQTPACDRAIETREQRDSLWAAAAQLPEGQYRALWLKYGRGHVHQGHCPGDG